MCEITSACCVCVSVECVCVCMCVGRGVKGNWRREESKNEVRERWNKVRDSWGKKRGRKRKSGRDTAGGAM